MWVFYVWMMGAFKLNTQACQSLNFLYQYGLFLILVRVFLLNNNICLLAKISFENLKKKVSLYFIVKVGVK